MQHLQQKVVQYFWKETSSTL